MKIPSYVTLKPFYFHFLLHSSTKKHANDHCEHSIGACFVAFYSFNIKPSFAPLSFSLSSSLLVNHLGKTSQTTLGTHHVNIANLRGPSLVLVLTRWWAKLVQWRVLLLCIFDKVYSMNLVVARMVMVQLYCRFGHDGSCGNANLFGCCSLWYISSLWLFGECMWWHAKKHELYCLLCYHQT